MAIPSTITDARNAILNQLILSTSPTWPDQAETICNAKTLRWHGTSGFFSVADKGPIRPIGKRAREVHDE